jgi:hypothetical protein
MNVEDHLVLKLQAIQNAITDASDLLEDKVVATLTREAEQDLRQNLLDSSGDPDFPVGHDVRNPLGLHREPFILW